MVAGGREPHAEGLHFSGQQDQVVDKRSGRSLYEARAALHYRRLPRKHADGRGETVRREWRWLL